MRTRPQFSYASGGARLSWSDPIPVHCACISPLPISEKQLPGLPQLFPNRGVRSRTPPRIRSLEVHRIAALQDWHLIRRSSHGDVIGPGFVGAYQHRHRCDKCSARPDAKHRRHLIQHDSQPLLKISFRQNGELQRDVPLTLKVIVWQESSPQDRSLLPRWNLPQAAQN
jgi:hypothetical protein